MTLFPRILVVPLGLALACATYRRPLLSEPTPRDESPPTGNESYQHRTDSAFVSAADSPVSTFSIDVDTASYANVRRYLNDGPLPRLETKGATA